MECLMATEFEERARRLRNAVEPVAAGVYFAPEAHAAHERLGFQPSPATQGGVARPDLAAYFTSRGACMGQVPGEVVAAAFGCFNPKVVTVAVSAGWKIADRDSVLRARGARRDPHAGKGPGRTARRAGAGHRS